MEAGKPNGDLKSEVATLHHEITERRYGQELYSRFIGLCTDAQDKMSYAYESKGDAIATDALSMFGILEDDEWLKRLDLHHLTTVQQEELKEVAYKTLVSLGDFTVRWSWRLKESGSESANRCLDILERAKFHKPTRAFHWVKEQALKQRGSSDESEIEKKLAEDAVSESAWDYYLPGHTAGWNKDLPEAIRSYELALRIQPDHFNSLFFLADRLSAVDDDPQKMHRALGLFSACIALKPKHLPTYWKRAIIKEKLGDIIGAEQDFLDGKKMASREGRLGTLQLTMISFYLRQNEFTKGRSLIRELGVEALIAAAEKIDEDKSQVRNFIAWVLANDPLADALDISNAVQLANEAVQIAPEYGGNWNTLGVAQYRASEWQSALVSLNKSIELCKLMKPQHSPALDYLYLAMTYWNLDAKDQSLQFYEKAVASLKSMGDADAKRVKPEVEGILGITPDPPESKPD